MREETFQQYAIVQCDSAKRLTEQLNDKLRELKDKDPVVSFEGLTARICYTERAEVPEDIVDEWKLKGVSLTCSQCPYYQPTTKSDGSVDLRSKKGMCSYSGTCRFGTGQACEDLYKMIQEGGVGLCLKK